MVQGLKNPMSGLKKYKTERGAAGMILRLGGTLDIAATKLSAKVGLHEIKPAFAGRGCVVIADIETPSGQTELALGIVEMNGLRAVFAGIDGLVDRPLVDCHRAWGFG